MNLFEQKIEQVIAHLKNNDVHLGYRRLIDCVLDTQNADWFRRFISMHEKLVSENANDERTTNEALAFLNDLRQVNVIPFNTENVLIKVDGLTKSYGFGFALGVINLELRYNEVWGLVGENGNGKTTFLRALAKDLDYNSGTITLNETLEKMDLYDQRSFLTYLPQRTPKWYGPLKSNLKFAASQYGIKGEMNELWVMMFIIRFGLYHYRNLEWSQLSSGYKMRFELARTFLRRPHLLLIDEPLANLDIFAQRIILEDLKYMSHSLTMPMGVILSSQQLFEVEKTADKIIFLKNGKPVLLHEANTQPDTIDKALIELETDANRELVNECFASLADCKIEYNGGQYLIEFNSSTGFRDVLQLILQKNLPIKYIRDISTSSRRLFSK